MISQNCTSAAPDWPCAADRQAYVDSVNPDSLYLFTGGFAKANFAKRLNLFKQAKQ